MQEDHYENQIKPALQALGTAAHFCGYMCVSLLFPVSGLEHFAPFISFHFFFFIDLVSCEADHKLSFTVTS